MQNDVNMDHNPTDVGMPGIILLFIGFFSHYVLLMTHNDIAFYLTSLSTICSTAYYIVKGIRENKKTR